MKLSTKGQYAVMAMADLASHSLGAPISLTEISERQKLPLQYLEQLFAKLRRNSLVESVRGQSGGYRLARNADKIAISHIVSAVDEVIRITRCKPTSTLSCQGQKEKCLTHKLWQDLGHHIENYLDAISLEDLCRGKS